MYPFMTLNDDTEITHSEMRADGRVKVYIETPDEKDGFHNAICYLPDYKWENINGYSDMEMSYFQETDSGKCTLDYGVFTRGRNSECRKFLGLDHILYIFGRMKMSRWNRCMSILQREEQLQMRQKCG